MTAPTDNAALSYVCMSFKLRSCILSGSSDSRLFVMDGSAGPPRKKLKLSDTSSPESQLPSQRLRYEQPEAYLRDGLLKALEDRSMIQPALMHLTSTGVLIDTSTPEASLCMVTSDSVSLIYKVVAVTARVKTPLSH